MSEKFNLISPFSINEEKSLTSAFKLPSHFIVEEICRDVIDTYMRKHSFVTGINFKFNYDNGTGYYFLSMYWYNDFIKILEAFEYTEPFNTETIFNVMKKYNRAIEFDYYDDGVENIIKFNT